MDYEIFLISVILRAGCNEIEANIVNCRMCLVARREAEKGENKNIKSEKCRDRQGYMALNDVKNTY